MELDLLDYSKARAPLTIPNNPIIQRLDYELYNNRKYFGAKVFRELLDGKSIPQIKKRFGHTKSSDTVNNFSRVLESLRGGISAHRLSRQPKEQLCHLAKGLARESTDKQLIEYLEAKIDESSSGNTEISNRILQGALSKNTKKAGVSTTTIRDTSEQEGVGSKNVILHRMSNPTEPGVYVYSYPQYLSMEFVNTEGRGLYKIGASSSVAQRIERQRRQTEVPEDLVLVRVFYSNEPFKLEAKFHSILKAANMHQKTTQGGAEWFSCPLAMIDAIAKAIK